LFRTTTAGANTLGIKFRLRAGGTDNSATLYSFAIPLVSNAANLTSFTGVGDTSIHLGNAATTFSTLDEIIISKPNVSTAWTSINYTTFSHNSNNFFGGAGGGMHQTNYQADGFTIFSTSSNITGTMKVYGYN
jgi:hypothetical protein